MKHVAFLRAINVGGRTVNMETLRALCGELGLADVETFIASGNVIYTADRRKPATLERAIEAHLEAALGYAVTTFVRTDRELAIVDSYDPFPEIDVVEPDVIWVGFLQREPDRAARERVSSLGGSSDFFRLDHRELYWLRRRSVGDSATTGAQIERALGMPTTMRNVNTVTRLVARYPAA